MVSVCSPFCWCCSRPHYFRGRARRRKALQPGWCQGAAAWVAWARRPQWLHDVSCLIGDGIETRPQWCHLRPCCSHPRCSRGQAWRTKARQPRWHQGAAASVAWARHVLLGRWRKEKAIWFSSSNRV
jgi:hypothetical protein